MSASPAAVTPAGDPVRPVSAVWRHTVPVDNRPHRFLLTSRPLYVNWGSSIREVDFWFEHASGVPETEHWLQVFGTGHILPPGARYRGTCPRHEATGAVFHLYEVMAPQ
jgi:hypothetical protein